MGKITQEMINEFNSTYLHNSALVIEKSEVNNCWNININDQFIKYAIITPSVIFIDTLEGFFGKKNIELSYNNTGTIFWDTGLE